MDECFFKIFNTHTSVILHISSHYNHQFRKIHWVILHQVVKIDTEHQNIWSVLCLNLRWMHLIDLIKTTVIYLINKNEIIIYLICLEKPLFEFLSSTASIN